MPNTAPLHQASTSERCHHPLDGASENPFLTPCPSRPLSRNVSGTSSSGLSAMTRITSSCIMQPPLVRDTARFVEEYSRLALQHSLGSIDMFEELSQYHLTRPIPRVIRVNTSKGCSTKTSKSRHRLVNKHTRNASPLKHKSTSNMTLSKKISSGSLLSRPSKAANQAQSLDDIFRLGGFSALYLTSSKRHIEFFIPTPLAATAQYLLKHGIF